MPTDIRIINTKKARKVKNTKRRTISSFIKYIIAMGIIGCFMYFPIKAFIYSRLGIIFWVGYILTSIVTWFTVVKGE